MTVNIEKMRFDIDEARRKSDHDQKWEARKFLISAILATAAAVGAGVGIGNLIWAHQTPPAPMQFPPGTVITIPPAPASK